MISVFLYNREQIILEGCYLAQLMISESLGVKENIVRVEFKKEDDKLLPNFIIDKNKIPLSKIDSLEDTIKRVWARVLPQVTNRLGDFEKNSNEK